MTKRSRSTFIFVVTLFSLIFSAILSASEEKSDFNLLSIDTGDTVLLGQLSHQSKWLLLKFWASDCRVCAMDVTLLSRLHLQHGTKVQVVGVALDGLAKKPVVRQYLSRHKPAYRNYIGTYREVAQRYKALTGEVLYGTPTYLLFTPQGELVANNPGALKAGAVERFIKKYENFHKAD